MINVPCTLTAHPRVPRSQQSPPFDGMHGIPNSSDGGDLICVRLKLPWKTRGQAGTKTAVRRVIPQQEGKLQPRTWKLAGREFFLGGRCGQNRTVCKGIRTTAVPTTGPHARLWHSSALPSSAFQRETDLLRKERREHCAFRLPFHNEGRMGLAF
jgi:hypothetical protein